jgi:hypothetical protein
MLSIKNGTSLKYPLPDTQMVTLWEWTDKITVYDFIKKIPITIEHPHWRWIGRTEAKSALLSFRFNPETRIIMPGERLRPYKEAIEEGERKALDELFAKEFDSSAEASLAIALNFMFAIDPSRGLIWLEKTENSLIKKEAQLKLVAGKYQWIEAK